MVINYPQNRDEWFAKGSYIDANGNTINFEIPAVFYDDDTCNEQETLAAVEESINVFNVTINPPLVNATIINHNNVKQ